MSVSVIADEAFTGLACRSVKADSADDVYHTIWHMRIASGGQVLCTTFVHDRHVSRLPLGGVNIIAVESMPRRLG